MRLWLLRHARVLAAPGLCYGASDLPADPEATRAAAQAAASLLPEALPMWVSGLIRARQLADALHELRPDLGPPRCDSRLNEMDFGQWEGRAWVDIPRAALDAWTDDFAHHRFGGIESTQMVLQRVAATIDDVQKTVGAHGAALWVTHAGVIRSVAQLVTHGRYALPLAHEWPKLAANHGQCFVVDLPRWRTEVATAKAAPPRWNGSN